MFWKEVEYFHIFFISENPPPILTTNPEILFSDRSSQVPCSRAALQTRPDRRRELGDPRGPGLRYPEVRYGPPTHTLLHHSFVWGIDIDQRLVFSDAGYACAENASQNTQRRRMYMLQWAFHTRMSVQTWGDEQIYVTDTLVAAQIWKS